jgi:DNA-binding transcriptional regulator YhcF (GntR family)
MDWKFNGTQPVYLQIMEKVRDAVLTGEFPPGSRVPSVRELAAQARVNPNTMQRALLELEREGVLAGGGTAGRCVSADAAILEDLRQKAIDRVTRHCAEQFAALGLSPRQAAQALLSLEEKEESV